MATWAVFAGEQGEFATRVRRLFEEHRHHTMATLRRSGSPRISGTEVAFEDGELVLGMMRNSRKALDLRRDPRLALHSHTVDPPADDPSAWCGDAKIAGTAIEVGDTGRANGGHRFLLDVTAVTLTRVGSPADYLVIESWDPEHGLVRRERR